MNEIERRRNQQPDPDRADAFDKAKFLLDHFPEPQAYAMPMKPDATSSDTAIPVRDYRLTVRLSLDERAALDELAQRLDTDKSAAVRTALLELLKRTPPF